MGTLRDLLAYKKAFALAMAIFEVTKFFPKEEMYSLTDQIETQTWLDFALACKYISEQEYRQPYDQGKEIAKLLHYMIN